MYDAIRPILFKLDPETAHNVTFSLARSAQAAPGVLSLLRSNYQIDTPKLSTTLFGLEFANPVGVAAGFDKNGHALGLLAALGFGFIEVGSVTNLPRTGNQKPRLFRLEPDQGLINRMGLNNEGPEAAKHNIAKLRRKALASNRKPMIVAVNIAKTHDPQILGDKGIQDMLDCYKKMAASGDFVVLNVSCPNTAEGKTFEDPEGITPLLEAVAAERKANNPHQPLLVKFSPDSTPFNLEKTIEVCERFDISGYVMVNTSNDRSGLQTNGGTIEKIGKGGLSGKPIHQRAVERVRFAHKLLGGSKPIIGLGGVDSAESAYEFIRAGASLVELYTGLVYQGPRLCREILTGLAGLLERDGFSTLTEAVGTEHH